MHLSRNILQRFRPRFYHRQQSRTILWCVPSKPKQSQQARNVIQTEQYPVGLRETMIQFQRLYFFRLLFKARGHHFEAVPCQKMACFMLTSILRAAKAAEIEIGATASNVRQRTISIALLKRSSPLLRRFVSSADRQLMWTMGQSYILRYLKELSGGCRAFKTHTCVSDATDDR